MTERDVSSHDENQRVDGICLEVSKLVKSGDTQKAAMLLKRTLERYPENTKLRKYLKQLKLLVKKKKIKKLEKEAILLMQSGAEDQAQKIFRQIYELDPTRTDLKDSLKKTRGEVRSEYNRKEDKRETIKRYCVAALIASILLIMIFALPYYSNGRHIKRALRNIDDKNYIKAKSALDECGWFMAIGKTGLYDELKSYELETKEQAADLFEEQKYKEAISRLKSAQKISANRDDYTLLIEEYSDLYKKQQDQIVEEKRRIKKAKESARFAERECRSAKAIAERKEARQEAVDICIKADDKVESAMELYEAEKYSEAQAVWMTAKEFYDKAVEVTQKTIALRNATEVLRNAADEVKNYFDNCMTAAYAANAQVEAKEDCESAESIGKEAQQFYAQNDYSAAADKWQEAADLFNTAKETAFESPSYNNAILITRKWGKLETGMAEKEVKAILKSPNCSIISSDSGTWYYQYRPKLKEDKRGGENFVEAKCGFVKFKTIGVQELAARLKDSLRKKVEKVKSTFARSKNHLRRVEGVLFSQTGIDKRRRYEGGNGYRSDEELRSTELQKKRLDNIYKSHEKKKKALLDGLAARKPIYIVSKWSKPDLDNIAELVNKPERNHDISFKPDKRWQVPVNWKKLKLNITDKKVHTILGEPDKTEFKGGGSVLSYGSVKGFGKIILRNRSDSSSRLDYWKEPFWDKELPTLAATSESDNEISN